MNTYGNETAKQAARRLAAPILAKGYKAEALHEYDAPDGSVLFYRIRAKHPETGDKWIRPMKLNGQGYELGEPKFPDGKPLYGLPRIVSNPDAVVWIVEGEQKADALNKLGLVATTSGGAQSAAATDWGSLRGRTVRIWPDNDDPGRVYADEVARILQGLGCAVSCIDVAALGLPEKGDAVDWLQGRPEAVAGDVESLAAIPAEASAPELAMEPSEALPESGGTSVDDEIIARLAALPSIEYDRKRKEEAETSGVRASTLDKLVASARKTDEDDSGIEDVDPWPEPVELAPLLDNIVATVRRFIVCDAETAHAVALWTAMTWLMDVVQIAPLAVITAPEKRCGKSLLLFVLSRLSCRPLTASNISPAALFRCIDAWSPTLLVDETDAFARANDELRGLLNCGHTRDGAYVVRTVGDDHEPRKFNTWGAKALAGIGRLADTLMDRAIVIELRRKLAHEQVDRLRHAGPDLFETLSEKLARFAEDYRDAVRRARPDLPVALNDRAQDNWEPLLAIADVAGGAWPRLGREAALKISGGDSIAMSTGTELLSDIQKIFEAKRVDRIKTADLISALCDDHEAQWATYNRGKPISPRQVARRLAEYDIKPKNVRIGYEQAKGFEREQFHETFARYLSAPPENPSHRPKTSEANNDAVYRGTDSETATVAGNPSVPLKAPPILGWDGGTDKSEGSKGAEKSGEIF
jgi:putative DNA primase/helicase